MSRSAAFECLTMAEYEAEMAGIYSHLDAVTKADTGVAMSKALG